MDERQKKRQAPETLADKARRLLEIDQFNLDVEWLGQAQLMFDFCESAAYASALVKRMKANLDLVRAEMAQKIRRRPLKYGLKRVTEAGIAEAVLLTHQYQEAQEDYIQAQYESEIYASCVRSCEHRKKALEWESQFHQSGYFAHPRDKGGPNGEMNRAKRDAAFGRRKRRRE